MAVEHVADHELLDGERPLDPARAQRAGHGLGHAEIGEGGLLHMVLLAAGAERAGAMWWGEIRLSPTARCAFRSKNLACTAAPHAALHGSSRPGAPIRWAASPRHCNTPADGPTPDDIQPTANETLDRTLTGLVTVVPVLALGLVGWQLWGNALGWNDIFVFVIMYTVTGLGITVGFHRLFTHRSFKTKRPVRAAARDLRLDGDRGPDHRPGSPTTASTTPSPTSSAIRTARTSTTATACAARCAACARARRLAVHPHAARQQGALRARPDEGPATSRGSTARSSRGRSPAS